MSTLIPNSFQTPNAYVDQFLHLLTGEEYKVLSYAARRIFGFQKRQDRISLSQFVQGTTASNGSRLDSGTGLGLETVRAAIRNLIEFGLIVKLADNDPTLNEGTLYELQLDIKNIDLGAMKKRRADLTRTNKRRTAAALHKRGVMSDNGGYVGHEGSSNVGHEAGVMSDITGGGNVGQKHKTQGKPVKKQSRNPDGAHIRKSVYQQFIEEHP